MKMAVVSSIVRGETDRLLSETATALQASGSRLAGVIKILTDESVYDENGMCDMDLRVLPDGPAIRITQALGEGSEGCRLDPGAITEAVAAVEGRGIEKTELFILNKFGPQEADGRGFRTAIASALAEDIPVLVGVGSPCREAFDTFADGMAESLPADPKAIQKWCLEAMNK